LACVTNAERPRPTNEPNGRASGQATVYSEAVGPPAPQRSNCSGSPAAFVHFLFTAFQERPFAVRPGVASWVRCVQGPGSGSATSTTKPRRALGKACTLLAIRKLRVATCTTVRRPNAYACVQIVGPPSAVPHWRGFLLIRVQDSVARAQAKAQAQASATSEGCLASHTEHDFFEHVEIPPVPWN